MGYARDDYYPAFDWLRIVLALVVASRHAGLIGLDHAGKMAVDVFFALSGWLIGGILLRSRLADLPRFYFNRATRIWIPYALAIALLSLASVLIEVGIRHVHLTSKWYEMTFYDVTFVYNWFGPPQLATYVQQMPLQGTGNHFWSICVEEQFYLVAPLVITALAFGRSVVFWVLLAIAAYIFNVYAPIAFGVCAAVVMERFGPWHERYRLHLGVVAAALFACVVAFGHYHRFSPPMALCIVLALAVKGPKKPVGAFFGGVSYPFYLNHWIGVFAANAAFGMIGLKGSVISRVAAVLMSLVVSAILYLVIDRNVMRRRSEYFTKRRGSVLALIGYLLVIIGLAVGIAIT